MNNLASKVASLLVLYVPYVSIKKIKLFPSGDTIGFPQYHIPCVQAVVAESTLNPSPLRLRILFRRKLLPVLYFPAKQVKEI